MTSIALGIIGDGLSFSVVKNIEIGVKGLVYKPSTRRIEAAAVIKGDWELLKCQFEFGLKLENGELVDTGVRGEFTIPMKYGLSLSGSGVAAFRPSDSRLTYEGRVGMAYKHQGQGNSRSLSVSAFLAQDEGSRRYGVEAALRAEWARERMFMQMSGSYGHTDPGPGRGHGKAEGGLRIEFGFRF